MRILITVAPLMYRESLALTLQRHRPDSEVLFGAAESLDGEAELFRPHLLIRNDTDGVDMELRKGSLCWIEILYSDGLGARINLAGEVWEIKDISTEDLVGIVDRVEKLMAEATPAY
ncbi:MAG: hypothetical protein M3494_09530 [Actinomycetota bacterium]|nr:hypothetical protein [Rubrobacter sp.]MDQ3508241.1 hypothetical protein [Actinomycetota bacterium]